MRIAIIEDELFIAEMLKELLEDLGQEVVGIANNYEIAINIIDQNNVDLYFLDINLGAGKSGFDVAEYINKHSTTKFVFLTSYSDKETINEAMQYQPQAYLCKPFSDTDLFTTIAIINTRLKEKNTKDYFVIKDGTQQIKIDFTELLYFKSNNIYVEIITLSKTYLIRNSIQKIMEEINHPKMIRIHRTYAVNMQNIASIASDFVIVANEKLPLSRLHKEELLLAFKN